MNVLTDIIDELKLLPPPSLERAAAYVHGLRKRTCRNRRAVLKETAGVFSAKEADAIERAIEAGCERIDPNDW